MPLEMPREMRLIVEADADGHLRHGLAVEQPAAGGIDPAPQLVAMGCDAERPGEAPHQMRRGHVEDALGLPQRQGLEPMLVEEVTKVCRDQVRRSVRLLCGAISEVVPESGYDDAQHGLGRERFGRIAQHAVECMHVPNERRVLDVGLVDGPADQPFIQDVGAEVEHALVEPLGAGGSAVVHDVRREDRDPRPCRAAMRGIEVVPDRALVDDEHRPRVVGVRRIRVVHESGMEHLVDAGNRRLPGADPFAVGRQDGAIVQDRYTARRLDGCRAETRRRRIVKVLAAFVAFAFVGTVSPGPNNTLLWASGMRFGFRHTLPHVIGTAIGMGALVVGVALGIGAILDAVPAAETTLKVVGSAYLLYVAYLVLRSGRVGASDISHPLTFWQGFAFQWVNPKAWVFVIAAVGAFVPPTLSRPAGVAALSAILMVIVIGSASAWAAGGAGLGQMVEVQRTRRVINIVLALLLVASVALLWI